MHMNKLSGTPVGADLSCTPPIYRAHRRFIGPRWMFPISQLKSSSALSHPPPIMEFNKIITASVGADLSCTPPIYRPSLDVLKSLLIC